MMSPVAHEAILASAGSGKTYQLSNRIVRLLAAGAEPGSVLALTFTRKAAGEFARRTLTKLAGAAESDGTARALARELELGGWDSARFAALLARTVGQLHRMRLGTLDSFYQGLVRMYFFELGLPGSFTLLDERLAETARSRVLRRIFRRDTTGGTAHGDFLAAFRLATWGREERGVQAELEAFIDEALLLLRNFPEDEAWSAPERLFPGGTCIWLPVPSSEALSVALDEVETFARGITRGGRDFGGALQGFAGNVRVWSPGRPLSDLKAFFADKLLPVSSAFLRGEAVNVEYNRKETEIPARISAALAVVLRHVMGGVWERHLRVTRGVHAVLRKYDDTYDRLVRRTGQLTFADTAAFLADSGQRLDISFRLDAKTHHWLFDEFQDTSRHDWRVVEDNVDAVLSDDTGERSAFFVGDVKQALYGWRGGDHTLLPALCARYGLTPRALDTTWRSSPAVLALVNAVFDNLVEAASFLPAATLADWQRVWHTHRAAGPALQRPGRSAWYVCEKEGRSAEGEESVQRRLRTVAALLREEAPLARGLTCGVLVQTNAEAQAAAGFLRAQGFHVTSEADMPVAEDNPVASAVLALLGHAAHPGDGYNSGVVALVPPLAAWRERMGGEPLLRGFLLGSVAERGFAPTLRAVADGLGEALPKDAFSSRRWEQLLALAREFDATGGRDIDDFILFARHSRRRDVSGADSVQVMTIHKSKGLEFDVVFLPFLEGDRLDSARRRAFIQSAPGAAERWVLHAPEKTVCENTPGLAAHLRWRQQESCYERLCQLYVALTRARHATYVVTTEAMAKTTPEGLNFPLLLAMTLAGSEEGRRVAWPESEAEARLVWESGAANWLEETPPVTIGKEVPLPSHLPPVSSLPRRRLRARRRPSDAGNAATPVASLFAGETQGAELGRCVHALLAQVGFVFPGQVDTVIEAVEAHALKLKNAFDAGVLARSLDLVSSALRAPGLQSVFAVPDSEARLWRERSFEVILDDTWISGVFDRVVFGAGAVWLQDFKTDRAVSPEWLKERYTGQINLYRSALEKLAGIPSGQIHAQLVHLPTMTVLPV